MISRPWFFIILGFIGVVSSSGCGNKCNPTGADKVLYKNQCAATTANQGDTTTTTNQAGVFDSSSSSSATFTHSSVSRNMATAYTVEAFVKLSSLPGTNAHIAIWAGGSSGYLDFYITSGGQVKSIFKPDCSTATTKTYTTSTLSVNTNYHIAVVWDGAGTGYIAVNGVVQTFAGIAGSPASCSFDSVYVGWNGSGNYLSATLDDLRISRTARYTSNFTPSSSVFTNDADTDFLLHFDSSATSCLPTASDSVNSAYAVTGTPSCTALSFITSPFF